MEEQHKQEQMQEPSRESRNAVFQHQQTGQHSMLTDVPYDTCPLPSRGLLYPEGNPLCGLETVDFRVMTTREEDILTSAALIKKGTVITELIKSCLMDKTIDVQEMVAGDRNALMVALRISGYGKDYPAKVQCPDCEHEFEHEFDLSLLSIKRLNVEPAEPGTNVFSFELPMSKQTVYFKFLTGKDEEEINIAHEKMKKLGSMHDNLITSRLKHSIVKVGTYEKRGEIARFVDLMRAGDSKALRSYIDKNEPGMVMRQDAECPACGTREEVVMPLGQQFFWPE